jgi:hypothetical protein
MGRLAHGAVLPTLLVRLFATSVVGFVSKDAKIPPACLVICGHVVAGKYVKR